MTYVIYTIFYTILFVFFVVWQWKTQPSTYKRDSIEPNYKPIN